MGPFMNLVIFSVVLLIPGSRAELMQKNCPSKCHCYEFQPGHLAVTCKGKKLLSIPTDIPRATEELYLSSNLIVNIPKDSFVKLSRLKQLSLKSNYINTIDNEAFNGLGNLTSLFLSGNKLRELDQQVFNPLVSIKYLYLSQNQFGSIPNISNCPSLLKFNIDSNELKNASFPSGFKHCQGLQSISLSNNPHIKTIQKGDFEALSGIGITKMGLSRCGIIQIANASFTWFPKLQSLVLSYNAIPGKNAKSVIDGLHGSSLTALDLSNVFQGDNFPNGSFDGLEGVPLQQLLLRHSIVSVLEDGLFRKLTELKLLDLSYSHIVIARETTFQGLNTLQRLLMYHNHLQYLPTHLPKSLLYVDISHNPSVDNIPATTFSDLAKLKELYIHHCNIRTVANGAFVRTVALRKLDMSHNAIGGTNMGTKIFGDTSQLEVLDLSYNEMTDFYTESKIFSQLNQLQNLTLSHNNCKKLPPTCFENLGRLQNLDLSFNNLASFLSTSEGELLFAPLSNLEKLDLSSNNLEGIPSNIFQGLSKTKSLKLNDNYISTWKAEAFQGLKILDELNLASNEISIVNKTSFSLILPNVKRVNLSSNPFSCYCELIWFRNWVNTTNITFDDLPLYRCTSPKSMVGKTLLEFHPESIMGKCKPPPWIMILVGVSVGIVFVAVIMSGVLYRKRWKIRLWVYKRKRAFARGIEERNALLEGGGNWEYDCYISSSNATADRDWVNDVLMPKIYDGRDFADEPEMGGYTGDFNVMYEDTHFKPEEFTLDQMANGISNSKHVMIVLSKHYLNDRKKIEFELPLALEAIGENGLDAIILVVLDNEDVRLPNSRLHDILDQGNALRWPENNEAGKEHFWLRLLERLQ